MRDRLGLTAAVGWLLQSAQGTADSRAKVLSPPPSPGGAGTSSGPPLPASDAPRPPALLPSPSSSTSTTLAPASACPASRAGKAALALFLGLGEGERAEFLRSLVPHLGTAEWLLLASSAPVPRAWTRAEALEADFSSSPGARGIAALKIDALPDELLVHVFSLLTASPRSLQQLHGVCRRWARVMRDEPLWARLCLNYAYTQPIQPAAMVLRTARTHHLVLRGARRRWASGHCVPVTTSLSTLASSSGGSSRSWRSTFRHHHSTSQNWRTGSYAVSSIPAHGYGILCMQFTEHVAFSIAHGAEPATLWDLHQGRVVARITGHGGGMVSAAALTDHSLLTGSVDRSIRRWDVGSGACLGTFHGHEGEVTAVLEVGEYLVSGSEDTTLRIWHKVEGGEARAILRGHRGPITCLDGLPFGRRVVSGSTDMSIRLWDWGGTRPRCIKTLRGHTGIVYALQADQGTCVSGSEDCTLKLWDLHTGKCHHTLHGHAGGVVCLRFDAVKIVSGSSDKSIKVWDRATGACRFTINQHTGTVWQLRITTSKILSAEFNQPVMVFDFGFQAREADAGAEDAPDAQDAGATVLVVGDEADDNDGEEALPHAAAPMDLDPAIAAGPAREVG